MAILATSHLTMEEELILPARFTVDGRPEVVALETRRRLRSIINELSDEDIDAVAKNAEAHRQSGQRIFLEVAYGETAGEPDATLLFKKSGTDITAIYTFYKDEEEGRDKRLLRELKRMEYLEKVVMRQLETTDRANSIGVVQGMIRSSSAFVKGLQSVFKQVETLSKAIERGLQNKSEMPSAEQKTAAIKTIQTSLGKLQPSAANHLAIKNMVQQQVDALLKNVAMPVAAQRATIGADTKGTITPISVAVQKNAASTPAITAPKAVAAAPIQHNLQTSIQNSRTLEATRPLTSHVTSAAASNRFTVLINPNVAQRIHTHISVQPLAVQAINSPVQQRTSQTVSPISTTSTSSTPTSLHVVVANPQLQRNAAPITRSNFSVIESKAGQQVLDRLARSAPVNATVNIQTAKVDAALPSSIAAATSVRPIVNVQPIVGQPIAGQPITGQPITVTPVMGQPDIGRPPIAQPINTQPTAEQTIIHRTITQAIPAQPITVQPVVAQPVIQRDTPQQAQPKAANNNTTVTPPVPQTTTASPATSVKGTAISTPTHEQPRAVNSTSSANPQRPTSKQETPRGDDPSKPEGVKSILGKAEPEKDAKKEAFKANAKSACEACAHKNCASCGVKGTTLTGVTHTQVAVGTNNPQGKVDAAEKKFAANAGGCVGCSGGKCAGCGVATVTADTAKVNSRFANLSKATPKTAPQHAPR